MLRVELSLKVLVSSQFRAVFRHFSAQFRLIRFFKKKVLCIFSNDEIIMYLNINSLYALLLYLMNSIDIRNTILDNCSIIALKYKFIFYHFGLRSCFLLSLNRYFGFGWDTNLPVRNSNFKPRYLNSSVFCKHYACTFLLSRNSLNKVCCTQNNFIRDIFKDNI